MAEFNAEVNFTRLEANVKSNQYRIDELVEKVNDIQEIVVCIREIAVEMKGMKEAQDEIKRNQEKSQEEIKKTHDELARQIRAVETLSDKTKASYVDKTINGIIAAVVAFMITKVLGK